MGLIPDALINLILLIAFAVYVAMGLAFFITGCVYMGDAGTIGATGLYLLFIGLIMMIVGGIALWANSKQIWLVLFVIELFNVALFLFLYILIVICLMMAMDVTDPVRKATKESWAEVLPGLTLPGSNPDGDGTAASGTYCEKQSAGDGLPCVAYYENSEAAPFDTSGTDPKPCSFGVGFTQMEVLNNCSIIKDSPDNLPLTALTTDNTCDHYYADCVACAAACMEAQIDDVKEALLPMSVFVLGLMVYLFVAIVWNNIMIADEELGPIKALVGYVVNGGLLGLSLLMVGIGGMGAAKAADACPGDSDCTPTSTIFVILIGLALMVLSGLVIAGIKTNQNMLMGLATLIMVFMAIALVLAALILGMSTGVVMEDMDYYYDTQYPKLRAALEKADNSYCRMSKADCTTMISSGWTSPGVTDNLATILAADPTDTTTVPAGRLVTDTSVSVTVKSGDDANPTVVTDDTDDDGVDEEISMEFPDVWKMMYAAASKEANLDSAPAWMSACATTQLCIYCGDLLQEARNTELFVWDAHPDATGTAGTECTDGTVDGCVVRAPNFNWADGIMGRQCTNCVDNDESGYNLGPDYDALTWPGAAVWTPSDAHSATQGFDRSIGSTNMQRCVAEVVGDIATQSSEVDNNGECIAPYSVDLSNNAYNVRCKSHANMQAAKTYKTDTANWADTDPCGDSVGADTLFIMPVSEWTDLLDNYTRWNLKAKESMPYCEEAIADFVADESNCKEYSNQAETEQNSYYANCADCNMPLTPFLFNAPGPDVGYRKCLNFFTGHMADRCSATSTYNPLGQACFDALNTDTQYTTMVDKAHGDDGSRFCGYSDAGCKAKIKYDISNSMSTMGIMGAIFLGFFLAVIYCTLEAIKHYMSGDDDDDDDDDE